MSYFRSDQSASTLALMVLTKLERNQVFEAIAVSDLDPAEFSLNDSDRTVTITHNSSGSTFSFWESVGRSSFQIEYAVADDGDYMGVRDRNIKEVTPTITVWANTIKAITETPDLWTELQRSRELVVDIQLADTRRLMQNLAVNPSKESLARLLRKFPTRLTNTRQRLLRPVERRFPRQTFPSRRSRCGSSVCQD